MLSLTHIQELILQPFPAAQVSLIKNLGLAGQDSLLLDATHALSISKLLRDHPDLRLDYCSNVTGVDWLDKTLKEKKTVTELVEGVPTQVEKEISVVTPGYLEAVYHLYSMTLKHGPVIIRLRTANRTDAVELPSLTPAWKSADFQEREIYDLFGIRFTGHPDLRRLLMWDEFEGHPMRKDYIPPDDEPLPNAIEKGAQSS